MKLRMAYVPIILNFPNRFMDSPRTYRITKTNFFFGLSQYKDADGGVLILLPALLLYLFFLLIRIHKCSRKQSNIEKSTDQCKQPPTAPYWVPLVGSLVPFFVNLESLLASIL